MANYVDGFVFPIPRDHLDDYRQMVEKVADIWKEHGALDYREYLADDMTLEGTRSFIDVAGQREGEVIMFGYVTFESREMRDKVNEKVASDPRMIPLMAGSDGGFDPARMAYGGFRRFV